MLQCFPFFNEKICFNSYSKVTLFIVLSHIFYKEVFCRHLSCYTHATWDEWFLQHGSYNVLHWNVIYWNTTGAVWSNVIQDNSPAKNQICLCLIIIFCWDCEFLIQHYCHFGVWWWCWITSQWKQKCRISLRSVIVTLQETSSSTHKIKKNI